MSNEEIKRIDEQLRGMKWALAAALYILLTCMVALAVSATVVCVKGMFQ